MKNVPGPSNQHFTKFISEHFYLLPQHSLSSDQSFMLRVNRCIKSNISNKTFNSKQLANAVNLSVSQLNRKLKVLIGIPSGKLIRRLRLQKAVILLMQDNESIGNIAYQTGFYDQAHFCRSFKQFFKCTPSKYKYDALGGPLLMISI